MQEKDRGNSDKQPDEIPPRTIPHRGTPDSDPVEPKQKNPPPVDPEIEP